MVELSQTTTLKCVYSSLPDYLTDEHSHEDHAMLLLPLVGSMTVEDGEGGGRRALESSFFYFADAGMPHATQSNRSKQEHMAIYLNSDWEEHVIGRAGLQAGLKHRAGIWRLSDNAADLGRILVRMAQNKAGDQMLLDRVGALFTEDCFAQIQTAAPTSPAHPFDHGMNLVLDALVWLRQNLSEPVSPDDLAAKVGVSRRHLSRLFREKTGRSISEMLKEERLKEAQRLLQETDWSVQQVATMCGIDSASHFSTAFKKRFGQSPVQYKKS